MHIREPISIKKVRKSDVAWSTHKFIMGCNLNTVGHIFMLSPTRVKKVVCDICIILSGVAILPRHTMHHCDSCMNSKSKYHSYA